MSTGRGWVMTPVEKAAALAEAKTRGLPDGWRVELDVSLLSVVIMLCGTCEDAQMTTHSNCYCFFFNFDNDPTANFHTTTVAYFRRRAKIDCNSKLCWIQWR